MLLEELALWSGDGTYGDQLAHEIHIKDWQGGMG